MNIQARKKQARDRADREAKARTARRKKPVLSALTLPEDAAGNDVRVILLGGRRALIENHLGVADVGRDSVRLTTRRGMLTVSGRNLLLTDVREGALAVEGRIESVGLPHPEEGADALD